MLPDATQSFTLTVDQAPAITSADNTTFTTGTLGTFTVTTTGFPTPPDRDRGAALGRDLRGQRQRHRHARRHARGGHWRHLRADDHRRQRRAPRRHPVLHAHRAAAVAAPTVTGLSPTSGPAAGGTLVTITGTGFTGATAVDFGTTAATDFTVVNDTTITAVSPAGTGVANVTVTTPAGTSAISAADQFTFVVAPPTVVSLVRFGFHMQQTSLVLTFSSALDATPAENVNNYQIMTSDRGRYPRQRRRLRPGDIDCDARPGPAAQSRQVVSAHG